MRPPRPLAPLAAALVVALPTIAGCGATTTVVAGGPVSTAPPPAADDASARPAAAAAAPDPVVTTTTPAVPATTAAAPTTAPAATTPATPAPAADPGTTGAEDTGGVLVERPAGFPNGGEAFLLARLHPEVARRCTRALADSLTRGAVAGLFCDGRETLGTALHYELFPTRLATEDAYGRYRRANDVPLDTGDCLAGPATGAAPAAEASWQRGAPLGFGRAMCFAGTDGRWLVSSHPRIRTLAFLLGDDAAALRAAWARRAAPSLRPR